MHILCTYLYNSPLYDSDQFFAAQFSKRLWKASSDEVWWIGESLLMSLQRDPLVIISITFSLTFVSVNKYKYRLRLNSTHFKNSLRLLNHFFLVFWSERSSCRQEGKISLWPLWTLWMWFSSDSHFAQTMSVSPGLVETMHQYKWLIMLRSHSPISWQSFCFAAASSFFRNPIHKKTVWIM